MNPFSMNSFKLTCKLISFIKEYIPRKKIYAQLVQLFVANMFLCDSDNKKKNRLQYNTYVNAHAYIHIYKKSYVF